MYLSKVTLLKSAHTASELAKFGSNGVYTSHQMLWKLFTDEDERNFLFREEMGPGGLPHYFVLSHAAPQKVPTLFDVRSKEFRPKLTAGQRLAFKLRVNPTVCITDKAGKSKRHDVLMHAKSLTKEKATQSAPEIKVAMEQAAQAWIADERRLANWGIQLDFLPEVERYTQHRSQKKSGRQIQFSSVDFQGCLTVDDPELFIKQYEAGFGRAKALGCGLMLIRPL